MCLSLCHCNEEIAGEAEVLQVFDLSDKRGNKANIVAGCMVSRGSIQKAEKFRLIRDGEPVHEGLLECASIRRHLLEVERCKLDPSLKATPVSKVSL